MNYQANFASGYSPNNPYASSQGQTNIGVRQGNNIVISPDTPNEINQLQVYERTQFNYAPSIPPPPPPLQYAPHLYQSSMIPLSATCPGVQLPTMVRRDAITSPTSRNIATRSRSSSREADRHRRNHTNKRERRISSSSPSSCSSSSSKSDKRSGYRRNVKQRGSKQRNYVDDREASSERPSKLAASHKRHKPDDVKMIEHGVGKEICPFCLQEISFDTQFKLTEHAQLCHKDKMFRCILCDVPTYYLSFKDIKMHLQIGHKVGKPEQFVKCPAIEFLRSFECIMCPDGGTNRSKFMGFNEESLTEIHFQPCHYTSKTFLKRICRICESSTHTNEESLTKHIITDHSAMLQNHNEEIVEKGTKKLLKASPKFTSKSSDSCYEISDDEKEETRKILLGKPLHNIEAKKTFNSKSITSIEKSVQDHLRSRPNDINCSSDTDSSSTSTSSKNDRRGNRKEKKSKKKRGSSDRRELEKPREPKRRNRSRERRNRRSNSSSSNSRSKRHSRDRARSSYSTFDSNSKDKSNYNLSGIDVGLTRKYYPKSALHSRRDEKIDEATQIAIDAKNAKMKNALNIPHDRNVWKEFPKESRKSRKNEDCNVSSLQRPNFKENYNALFSEQFMLKDGYCYDCDERYKAEKAPEHYSTRSHYKNTSNKFRCQICLDYTRDIKAHLSAYHVKDVFACQLCPENRSSYLTLEMRKMLDHFYNFHPTPGNRYKVQQLPSRNDLLMAGKVLKPNSLECFGCKLCNANYMCRLEQVVEHQLLEDGITIGRESDIRFTCRVCGPATEFADYSKLKGHIEENHNIQEKNPKEKEITSAKQGPRLSLHNSTHFNSSLEKGLGKEKYTLTKFVRGENLSMRPRNADPRNAMVESKRNSNGSGKESKSKEHLDDTVLIKEVKDVALQYHCFYCAEEFRTSNVRQRHITMQHDANLFSCELECTSFTTNCRRAMLLHLDEVHYYYHDEGRSNRTEFLKQYSIPPTDGRQVSCRLCKQKRQTDYCNDDEGYEEELVGIWMAQDLEALNLQFMKHIRRYHPSKSSKLESIKNSTQIGSTKINQAFPLKKWFKLECRFCNDSFTGPRCVETWKEHAERRHDPVDSLIPVNSISTDESDDLEDDIEKVD